MRFRTYFGVLIGTAALAAVSYFTHHNWDALQQPFRLGSTAAIPLWAALLTVFVLGFLPTFTYLLVGSVRQDLALRDERRKTREAESLTSSFRRAIDYYFDTQYHKAADELEFVLGANPGNFSALLAYGETLRQLGQNDRAIEVHQRGAVHHPQSVALLYQLAEDYEARGDAEVAREIRNRVLREFPGFGRRGLLRRRNAAMVGRNFAQALELDEKAHAFDLEHPALPGAEREGRIRLGLLYQKGVDLLEAEKVDEAIATFEMLLEREPHFLPARIMLGEAELVREDEERAVAQWIEGWTRTQRPVFLQRIEDHYIESGEPRRAIESLRRAMAQSPDDLVPRFFLGRLYARLEMHDEALKILDGLGERIGKSPAYRYLLGRIHERRGEMRLAVDAYRACAQELGVAEGEYRCRICGELTADWRDRCEGCGSWNSVELHLEPEKTELASMGVPAAAVWEGPEGWDPDDSDEALGR